MSNYQQLRDANRRYAIAYNRGSLGAAPARKLAVVTCMDARLTVEAFLGLRTGEAHIIRNAGAVVTDDVLRSLIISSRLLGTREFFVIAHTDCGMLTFSDEQLRHQLRRDTGVDARSLVFHTFTDLQGNVRAGVAKIKNSPFILEEIQVRGFIYQVENGLLKEID